MDDAATGGWSAAPVPETGPGRPPPGPDAVADDGAVVAVGAVCEVDVPWDASTRQVSLALSEYLAMESGTRVVLHSERGVTIAVRGDGSPEFTGFTADELRDSVLGALLPDEGDDEEPGQPHPWRWLAELAVARNVRVTPEELASLPYELDFRPAVRALLRPDES